MINSIKLVGFILSLIIVVSCISFEDNFVEDAVTKTESIENVNSKKYSDVQKKLIEGAFKVKGAKKLEIRGKKFNMDCTGVILAIYYYAGIDLASSFNKYSGNGVKRIHSYLNDQKLLYKSKTPQPGDIIFWDNTYDKNSDKKWNDPLTHVGMVVLVTEKGQIDYIHHNYRRGIILEKMNLNDPDSYTKNQGSKVITVNSPMRMKSNIKYPKWLSSHLYKIFGKGYLLKK